MHEAKWNRAKADPDKGRTGGSTFRTAISNARNERTSRLWARAALFEHAAAPGQARAAAVEQSAAPGSSGTRRAFCGSGEAREAPVEHSAAPGQARAAPVEYSAALGQARAAISSHLRPFRAICGPICGPGAGSTAHSEPSAAPGRARAAISSILRPHLRPRGGLERPFRAICGSRASSSSHFEPICSK